MNLREYQTVLLAALLHDLGTLFGNDALAPVQEAEANPALRQILNEARDAATPGGQHKDVLVASPLVSVFSFLTRTGVEPVKTPLKFDYAPLESTDKPAEYLFPKASPQETRREYIESFRKAYDDLTSKTANERFFVRLTHLTALVQRFARCLAAHSDDVCLYDHLQLTTAIAACLYQLHDAGTKPDKPFALVVGDLSGIQDYIFDIATVGAGGAARRLRARSFSIGLISDMTSHALAQAFDVPLANILMSSGGKFYVLLPNLPSTKATLEAFRHKVDAWLYEQYNGEIGLNLAWSPLAKHELDASGASASGFGAFVGKLNRKLAVEKLRRSQSVLHDESKWTEKSSVRTKQTEYHGERDCVSCHKFPGRERNGLCEQCAQQSRLGSKLTRARAIAFYHSESGDFIFLRKYSARVLTDDGLAKPIGSPYLVVQINDPDLSKLSKHPAAFRYLANYVPSESGEPLAFDDIAGKAETAVSEDELKGRKLLGYVKGDADHLGSLFAEGLRAESETANRDNAAHIVALSRELDLFFSGWLEHTLSKEHKYFYTIFSGGDDLFVLGPWNQTVDLATEVNEHFRKFACYNPAMTLSAGILYTKPRYPISRAARDAEDELEKSKEPPVQDERLKPEERKRNRLTVLGDTLPWGDELEVVRKQINGLSRYDDDALRSSFLYRLIHYGEMYQHVKDPEKAEAARYKSHFAYTVARNLRDDRSGLREWADALLKDLFDSKPSQIMDHLGLIATIVLFTRRTRRR